MATGLEIVRAFRDSGIRTEHTVEIIDFLAEEPSEYGLSCVGSRGMTGLLDARMLSLTGPGGEALRDALVASAATPIASIRPGATTSRHSWNCISSRASCSNPGRLTSVS